MKKHILFFAAALTIFSACSKDDQPNEFDGKATLSFDSRVGAEDFALNKDFTLSGRTYQFTGLRYWISNVVLIRTDGVEYKVPASYHLIEEVGKLSIQDGQFEYPANKRENVTLANIPIGEYKAVRFSVGVDTKYNDNLSLQAGELSQLNGMTNVSWMWHTTYIFSALSGKVTEGATTKNIKVETGMNANYKTLTLQLPAAVKISSAKETTISLQTDVARIFEGVDLITTPTVGAAQVDAMQKVAGNYETKAITVKAGK